MIKYGFYLLGYNRSNSRTLTSDSDSAAAGNILFSSHIKDRIWNLLTAKPGEQLICLLNIQCNINIVNAKHIIFINLLSRI